HRNSTMKKTKCILCGLFMTFFLAGFFTHAAAQQCGSGLRCDQEGAPCKPRYGNKGTCTQIVKGGAGNIPDGCYCRASQLILLPIWTFPIFEELTLQEAYQAQAELDQLQDDLDAHIMELEAEPEQ